MEMSIFVPWSIIYRRVSLFQGVLYVDKFLCSREYYMEMSIFVPGSLIIYIYRRVSLFQGVLHIDEFLCSREYYIYR